MIKYENLDPKFSESIKVVETTDKAHADNINQAPKQLLQNDLVLNQEVNTIKNTLGEVDYSFVGSNITGALVNLNTQIGNIQLNFQDGVNSIYNTIVSAGVTPRSKALTDIISGIENIASTSSSLTKVGTATEEQVLEGYTFTNETSSGNTGTMSNYDSINQNVDDITINESGEVIVKIPNIGYYTTDSSLSIEVGNANAEEVVSGKTFTSSNGVNITGTMINNGSVTFD